MKKKTQRILKIQKGGKKCTSKETLLIDSLTSFYGKNDQHVLTLKSFLKDKKRRLSLRLLDWLVTNYAKKHSVVIERRIEEDGLEGVEFMYLAYKNYLKSYSKKFFDAFARRQRVFYSFRDNSVQHVSCEMIDEFSLRDDGVITTIAQLNAFRFFIIYGVIDYAIKNLDNIERDMVSNAKENSSRSKEGPSVFNAFAVHKATVTIRFRVC